MFASTEQRETSRRRITRFPTLESLLALAFVSLIAQLTWPALAAWQHRPRPGSQVPYEISLHNSATGSHETRQQCLLYLPIEYDSKPQTWPLVIYLHGSGERGSDISLVNRLGLPHQISSGKNYPFLVLSPQCPAGQGWEPGTVVALIDHTANQFAVDRSRIYLTGFSMGGHGTWTTAQHAPDRFAAIAPLAGGGNPANAATLKNVPIWAFHGGEDNVVPLESSQKMVDAVYAAGGDAKLTVYPRAGHGICERTYSNPALFKWLLSHSKNVEPGEFATELPPKDLAHSSRQ